MTAIVDDDMTHRLQPADGVTVVSRSAFEAACRMHGDCDAAFLDVDQFGEGWSQLVSGDELGVDLE